MPQENAQKVSKRIRRIRGKYLSVDGAHYYLRLFAVYKIVSEYSTRKVFKRIGRMRGKNLCIHGEDAKRLLAYSPNTPKVIKVCIYWLIIIRILKFFGIYTIWGWIKPKNHLTLLSL